MKILLALFAFALPLSAQWPQPSKTTNTPVPCTVPVCAGKSVPGWSAPITGYVGRYLNSSETREFQVPIRTLRARTTAIDPAHNRVYMISGGGMLGAYALDRFIARLSAGEAMQPVTVFGGNFAVAGRLNPPETLLTFDRYFYAERSWPVDRVDGQDRLNGFDFDDRGIVYVAYDVYGAGVLDQNLTPLARIEGSYFGALSVRVGQRYYLIVSAQNGSARLYDVTDTSNPTRLSDLPFTVKEFARTSNGDIAITDGSANLRIFTPAGLISGQATRTIKAPAGTMYSVTSDGGSFYALSCVVLNSMTRAMVTVVSPTATKVIDIGLQFYGRPSIRYGAGWIAVFGQEAFVPGTDLTASASLRLYKLLDGSMVPVQTLTTSGRQYFASVYASAYAKVNGFASGMLSVGIDAGSMGDAEIFEFGGETYLVIAAVSLGDLYRLLRATAPLTPPVVVPPPVEPPVTPPCACPPPPPALPPVVVPPPQPPPQPPNPPCVCSREHLECCGVRP